MSLQTKVIGIGAAGNKAAIQLLKDEVMDKNNILLLNSTLKDIPQEYKELGVEFGNVKGAGKERELAKSMMVDSMQGENINMIDNFINPTDKMVIIATSSEGGTGSGASIIVAKYIKEVLEMNVHLFVFTGFEDDARGLKNTVDWFNDLSEDYTVEAISNQNFLSESKTREEAEISANKEFSKRVSILVGNYIVPSTNNIDDTDLYKTVTTTGYMTVEHHEIEKLKSTDEFNDLLENMVDNSKSIDTEVGNIRMAVICNVTPKNRTFIDENFTVLKEKYGQPFELFTHFQNTDSDEFIHAIVSGMKLPIDTIKKTYDSYIKQMEEIDFKKDKFFASKDKFDTSVGNELDFGKKARGSIVDDENRLKKSKANFFSSFNTSKEKKTNTFTNITKNEL